MDDKELHIVLFSAIQHNNYSLLDDLLDGENGQRLLDLPGNDGNTLLHAAVIENDLKCVECLIKHGANPNVFDTIRARTPLHLAVELGQTDIAKAFLELEHINLELRDDRNLSCHEIAQFCDNQNLANLISARQAKIEELKNDFYSVLNQACSNNEPNLVSELLDKYEKQAIEKLPTRWRTDKDYCKRIARLSLTEFINWSSSSWNGVTLLFKSASKGHTEVCRVLIEFGATAKCNENTNYSPLYVAAYGGYTETVQLLLESFLSLVQEVTIEKWTVLHACCLQGHSDTTKLILTYPYPDAIKRRYISRSGLYEYHYAFDLNAQDAAGQTAIYLAVSANNEKLLDTLLQYNLEATVLEKPAPKSTDQKLANQTNETRRRSQERSSAPRHARIIPDRPKVAQISETDTAIRFHPNNQLDKIIRQLHKYDSKDSDQEKAPRSLEKSDKYLICPFELDTYCDYNSKTALHLAVCQQYHTMATTLLVNGSNPNLPILSRESVRNDFTSSNIDIGLNWLRSSKSTCLKEACKLNDEYMCDILIRYGARDNQDNLALQVAASNKNSNLISKLLSLKSNPDPEFKINKKCNVEFASRFKQGDKLSKTCHGNVTTTFSSMFPSVPVMIDWQNLRCMRQIDHKWLIDASLLHNKRLKHPTNSLMAITRLDLSSNNLRTVHPAIYRLPSLRELNLSSNRIESLLDMNQRPSLEGDTLIPTSKLIESHKTAMKRSQSNHLSSINLEQSNIIDLNEPQEWDLPNLVILDLHDNLLLSLPDCLFKLPKLRELDVSSNQIRQLPSAIWTAPALEELIASGNLLDDLPKAPPEVGFSSNLRSIESYLEEQNLYSIDSEPGFEDRLESNILSRTELEVSKDAGCNNSVDDSGNPLRKKSVPLVPFNQRSRQLDFSKESTMPYISPDDSLDSPDDGLSKMTYLNLSHNSFVTIPSVLACMATELIRLNLSFNRIEALGSVDLYPMKIKNLDISNNQISTWFTSSRSHQRLENLKSFNLSYNLLKDIQIHLPQDLNLSNQSKHSVTSKTSHNTSTSSSRDQLLFPSITVLDLSYNKIQQVPAFISELKDLSVLNLSGNTSISSLPAELGLASKLWNLGISGCSLNEPLKSIVESKTYKTMDIIGYLKSILEEAKPYARMKLMLLGLQGVGKTTLLEQMRQEGSTSNWRNGPEHWTKRMGHFSKTNLRNQKGVTLSTVGVDIHDWTFCKRATKNQPNYGPVSFSTWDFGGQHEFYATHRYFLSRRSMYLVVWRLTDGFESITGIQQWLVNIQSRAPGSPVIIVGTHEDMVSGGERGDLVQQLQAKIYNQFINVEDHDKCGLPRVFDSIVISTKTKLNVRNLCNRIYDVVYSLRCPGSTERLLEQKIPATYLYLGEIVSWIVSDRHQRKREPVLTYDEYKHITSEHLKSKYHKVFRDLEPIDSTEVNYNSELQQATRFLHENGVLLHYEDANLRDLYFLDPQWLCDILSHVVTIREINPYVRNGLMKIDDLGFLFKSIDVDLKGGVQSYVVNLLNKFEVALTWNDQYLLIPSLLPADPNSLNVKQDFQVKIGPGVRGRSVVGRYEPNRGAQRSTSIGPKRASPFEHVANIADSFVEFEDSPEKMMNRIVLLRYLPAGFFARLQSGMLSDPTYDEICSDLHASLFDLDSDLDNIYQSMIGSRAGWTCWKSGLRLVLQKETAINTSSTSSQSINPCLLTVREFSTVTAQSIMKQENFKIECVKTNTQINPDHLDRPVIEFTDRQWCDLDVTQYLNVIMVSVPKLKLKVTNQEDNTIRYTNLNHQSIAKLLANTVDHIDNLLEDWYPSLGMRFAHTLGGNYLVTRIVPCNSCAASLVNENYGFPTTGRDQRSSRITSSRHSRSASSRVNFSIGSATPSHQDTDESSSLSMSTLNIAKDIYCFYVEHCILTAYNLSANVNSTKYNLRKTNKRSRGRQLQCPLHGTVHLDNLVPDIIFDDIPDCVKVENEQIERCKLIGRGTFGFVFKGSLRIDLALNQLAISNQEVALKLLQPVDPGLEADNTDIIAYNSSKLNWTREPFQCACKAYCTARHEVNILQKLRHPNIVSFIGLCIKPLAIVLELAPLGCLTDVLRDYKRTGTRIDKYTLQKTILQVARALEFLHQQRVIYRDLKAENVLVWSFPSPFATNLHDALVELKLADYGISRQALSTGIWKGFAGTINFLAPEILRHNGDEEYTEKVDCFSFGMFMYELITLRQPFKHTDCVRGHLADGNRPSLTARDMIYPNQFIDLMRACWSQEPHHRPTASQIVSIASSSL